MSLADLIHRKKTATVSSPATAILAIPAIVEPFTADIEPRIATIATIAVAGEKYSEITKEILTTPTTDPKALPHYCEHGDCHCSAKLPGRSYPAGCLRIHCEYYPEANNV